MSKILDRLAEAVGKDAEIVVERAKAGETLGSDPRWLAELGLDKSALLRLERLGWAVKARYATQQGPHRVRWILFKEALDGNS